MSLRKWLILFVMTIAIGAAASAVVGPLLQLSDPGFRNVGARGWIYNVAMMALSGLTFGAFSHMGFFAYLTLNYIARSIFRRPYLWVAFQGFCTVFILAEVAVMTYDTDFPDAVFWAVPLALTAASVIVAWWKVRETTSGSWVPTLFFMIGCTVLETVPAFRTGRLAALLFTLIPLYACNVYQIMQLHRILRPSRAAEAAAES